MITGLKVWDREGNEISNITGRYPKFIANIIVNSQESRSINYNIPQGTTRIVVPVYLSRNDTVKQTQKAGDGTHDIYDYNLWSINVNYTNSGFEYSTEQIANVDKQKPPIKLYWGYV